MTTRERWIIYPLLFLTLGIALRNQFLPTRRFGAVDLKAGEISAQKVICNDIVVIQKGECSQMQCDRMQFNEALGKHLVTTGLTESPQIKSAKSECQALVVTNSEGKPMVVAGTDNSTKSGVIQTMNPNGMPLVQIRSTEAGGIVTTVGHGGKVLVAMGHEGQNYGVFGQFPQIGPPFLLTAPWQGSKPATPKPSNTMSPVTPLHQDSKPTGDKTP